MLNLGSKSGAAAGGVVVEYMMAFFCANHVHGPDGTRGFRFPPNNPKAWRGHHFYPAARAKNQSFPAEIGIRGGHAYSEARTWTLIGIFVVNSIEVSLGWSVLVTSMKVSLVPESYKIGL